jgi:hypothetical protein
MNNVVTPSQKHSALASNGKRTLDIQHTNKLNEFHDKISRVSSLKQKYNELQERIMSVEAKRRDAQLNIDEYDQLIALIDERDDTKKVINHIESTDDEVDYLINTAPILFKYYDIVEKGNPIDELTMNSKINNKSILKFFLKPQETDREERKGEVVDRASLVEKYLAYTDDNYIRTVEQEECNQCTNCGSSSRNVLLNDGIIYCNDCSCVEYIIVDHDKPSYKEVPREVTYFAYKRKLICALKSHMPQAIELWLRKNICLWLVW